MKKKIKKILFLTGTRADFGKIKPLILRLQKDKEFMVTIFVTGMHMLEKYGKLILRSISQVLKIFINL